MVACFRQCQPMVEREGRLRRIIRSPRALDHDLQLVWGRRASADENASKGIAARREKNPRRTISRPGALNWGISLSELMKGALPLPATRARKRNYSSKSATAAPLPRLGRGFLGAVTRSKGLQVFAVL